MQLYGLDVSKPKDSQRIQVVVAAQRNQTKSFHSRPHAELNAILISRNLCHNYFLIISHSARPRCRISHCVRDGLKFNNKNAVKFLFVRFCLDFHRDSDSHSHSDSGCNLITLTTLSVFFWGMGRGQSQIPCTNNNERNARLNGFVAVKRMCPKGRSNQDQSKEALIKLICNCLLWPSFCVQGSKRHPANGRSWRRSYTLSYLILPIDRTWYI